MILTVTPNPCVDKTIFLDELRVGTFMRAPRYTCIAGGKGTNVARAAHVMGAEARALVVVGGHTGRHVVDMIEGDGVPCIPVWVESLTRTITTVLEEPVHRQTAFFEPGSRITNAERDAIVAAVDEAARDAHVVALCGTVSDPDIADLYQRLIPIAKAHGARVFLDTHGPELAAGLAAEPDLIKPNVAEAEKLLNITLDSRDACWSAIDELHRRGAGTVVLSLGKDGALLSDGATRLHGVPPKIDEVNAVGSGDALLAGFAVGLVQNRALEERLALGIAMGAANAQTWDIGHFTREEVEGVLGGVEVREMGED